LNKEEVAVERRKRRKREGHGGELP